MRKLIHGMMLAGVCVLSFVCTCQASLAYRVEHSKVRLSIAAGGSYSGIIRLYSQSKNPIHLKVYFEDWAYASEQDGSKNFYPAGSKPYSCAGWVTYKPDELILPAFGVQSVNYVVNVPPDAKGGYYAVMFFEAEASQEDLLGIVATDKMPAKSDIGIALRLGSLFYIDVKNTVSRKVSFDNFKVIKRIRNAYSVNLDMSNAGNADIAANGNFYVMDSKGMVYGRGEFATVYAFPGDTATMSSEWKADMPAGDYDVVFTFDLGKGFEDSTKEVRKGPLVTKEAQLTIDARGEVEELSRLK